MEARRGHALGVSAVHGVALGPSPIKSLVFRSNHTRHALLYAFFSNKEPEAQTFSVTSLKSYK